MKKRLLYKAISIFVLASIIATSLQFANPVNVYAEEENTQTDAGVDSSEEETSQNDNDSSAPETNQSDNDTDSPVPENSQPLPGEPEDADGVNEVQVFVVVLDNVENQEPNQELNLEANQVQNQQINQQPNVELPGIDESSIENVAATNTDPDPASIENTETDETDEADETDSDAIGEKAVLNGPEDSAINDPTAGANGDAYPDNSYAKEGYGASNENREDPKIININLGNGIILILTGVNDSIYQDSATVVNIVKKFLNIDGDGDGFGDENKCIKYMNSTAFIDAEKYSIDYQGYDSNYCWGATAANMLWLSGWGKRLGYTNEDQIMSDLHDKFNDTAEEPRDAITWLFDNYINNVEVQTKDESTLGGKESSLCISEAFNTYRNVADNLNNLNSLANVASQATAIQCHWMDSNGDVKDGSHWLTATGVVINQTATNIADYFKAVILADSDDTPGRSESAPSNDDQSYNQRIDTINVYKICTLETKNVNGVDYWYIPGYVDGDGSGALITGIESLDYYTSDLEESIKEQHGTKNVNNTLELIYGGIMYTYGGSVTRPQYTFCDESTNVRIGYANVSKISVQNVQVPVSVTICNENNQEIDSDVYYIPVEAINATSRGYFDINIDNLTNNLSAGDYRVKVMFNPYGVENYLEEAYYLNNDIVTTWITLEEKRVEPDESETESDETSSDEAANNEDANIIINTKELTEEEVAAIDEELQKEGISKDTVKAIEQIFSQSQVTYFAPETKIDTTSASDYKVFMAGTPGEFVSAEIDGVKIDLSELKLMRNSADSYRIIFDGKTFKGLKKGKHRLVINSVRGALPIVIEITVL